MTPAIPSYATDELGVLLVADGLHPVQRWDGFAAGPVNAGLAAPATAVTLAASGSGTITGSYYAFLRYVDSENNFSDASPQSLMLTATNAGAVNYSSLEVPTNPRVVRRQVLRSTAGQAAVFYLDIDTTDLTSTSLTSTRVDSNLSTQQAVPLFDAQNLPFLNSHGVPPDWKSVIAAHRDRLFMAGEVIYQDGSVSVSNGSTLVRGAGTNWPATFVGRWLWVDGASRSYEIAAVDVAAQTATLLTAYADPYNPYARYGIRPAPAEARLIYFSGPGEGESWPAFNALGLPADDDIITGLMPFSSWIYVLERVHSYRVTYKDSPTQDGSVFLAANRGCVNQRCWTVVEGNAYLLDEFGVYKFDGNDSEPLSAPIQDFWESEHSYPGDLRIQWSARDYFHSVYYPAQEVIRWFVTLSGTGLPRHALAYELRRQRWWVEEFSRPVGSSCLGRLQGEPKVFLGGASGEVNCYGVGQLDQADDRLGPVRGTVTAAGTLSLTDAMAQFPASFVGAPVTIAAGTGEGQQRIIVSVAASTLHVDRPWVALPDATSTYQIGGVRYQWRSGRMRWADSELLRPRRVEMIFRPCHVETTSSVRVFTDRETNPDVWAAYYGLEYNKFASTPGLPDLLADLRKLDGMFTRRLDSRKDIYLEGNEFLAVDISGVTNTDPVVLVNMIVDGIEGGR